MEKRELTPQEKAELRKLYEVCPDFYKKSEADKKKYGEKKLIEMNRKLMDELNKEAKERKQALEINEEEIQKVIEKEGESILKSRVSVLIENNPLKKND